MNVLKLVILQLYQIGLVVVGRYSDVADYIMALGMFIGTIVMLKCFRWI